MRCNLITNPASSGLARDIEVLSALLTAHGISTHIIDNFSPVLDTAGRSADVNLFLEALHEGRYLQSHASANWFIPNSEWYFPEWDRYLPLISLVCCKTPDAHRLWAAKVGPQRCLYTAFDSRDLYLPGVNKFPSFLHVAGKSTSKGTETVLEAWRTISHPLTIVTQAKGPLEEQIVRQMMYKHMPLPPSVRHWHSISDELLAVEMNRNRFFILPSLYEGWGQALHEAMSARAAILTTDAPPMSEFLGVDKRLLIPVERTSPRMCVKWHHVSAEGIRSAVARAMRLTESELEEVGDRARTGWEQERTTFRETFMAAVKNWYRWI